MKLIENIKAAKASGVQVKSFSMTETHRGVAWSCNVFLDGKKLGMVDNSGNGGHTDIGFDTDLQKKVVTLLKDHGYKLTLTLGDMAIEEPSGIDTWLSFAVGQMGDELAELKSYKRKAKTGIFITKTTVPVFAFHKMEDTPRNREAIKAHHGDAFIAFLNEEFAAL